MELTQLSLRQFAVSSQRMHKKYEQNSDDKALFEFLQFTLAGEATEDGQTQKFAVNALQGTPAILHDELVISRDIDSVIGVTTTLPFKVPLSVFPMAPFMETLKRTNHITQPVQNAVSLKALQMLFETDASSGRLIYSGCASQNTKLCFVQMRQPPCDTCILSRSPRQWVVRRSKNPGATSEEIL